MDEQIRTAAFLWVEKQVNLYGGFIPRQLLDQGFQFQGKRITLIGSLGIWEDLICICVFCDIKVKG